MLCLGGVFRVAEADGVWVDEAFVGIPAVGTSEAFAAALAGHGAGAGVDHATIRGAFGADLGIAEGELAALWRLPALGHA